MREFFQRVLGDPATVRKFVVAFVGAVGVAISQGLLPEAVTSWFTVVVAFLTALGVYAVPNAKDPINVNQRLGINTERGAITVVEALLIVLVSVVTVVLVVWLL